MKDLVYLKDQKAITTSLIVAEKFGKRHYNVLRDIENLECSDDFNRLNFEGGSYLDANNQKRPMYEMTRDGFMFLVMGYTGEKAAIIKETYIQAFNKMEEILKSDRASIENISRKQLAQMIIAVEEEKELLEKQIEEDKPFVEQAKHYLEGRYHNSNGIQSVAHKYANEFWGLTWVKLGRFLRDVGMLYKSKEFVCPKKGYDHCCQMIGFNLKDKNGNEVLDENGNPKTKNIVNFTPEGDMVIRKFLNDSWYSWYVKEGEYNKLSTKLKEEFDKAKERHKINGRDYSLTQFKTKRKRRKSSNQQQIES